MSDSNVRNEIVFNRKIEATYEIERFRLSKDDFLKGDGAESLSVFDSVFGLESANMNVQKKTLTLRSFPTLYSNAESDETFLKDMHPTWISISVLSAVRRRLSSFVFTDDQRTLYNDAFKDQLDSTLLMADPKRLYSCFMDYMIVKKRDSSTATRSNAFAKSIWKRIHRAFLRGMIAASGGSYDVRLVLPGVIFCASEAEALPSRFLFSFEHAPVFFEHYAERFPLE